MIFTPEQKIEVTDLYLSGLSMQQISDLYESSHNVNIFHILKANGITKEMRGSKADNTVKLCRSCKIRLPIENFEVHPTGRGGKRNMCSDCRAAKKAATYQVQKEEICRKLREERSDNYDKNRESDLRKKFKITTKQFEAMLQEQGNCCMVCQTTIPGGAYNQWHIDHDHACCSDRKKTCGKCIRGILCSNCNLTLGTAKDSPTILRGLADYLEAYDLKKVFE